VVTIGGSIPPPNTTLVNRILSSDIPLAYPGEGFLLSKTHLMAYKETSYEWRRDQLLILMRRQIPVREITTGRMSYIYEGDTIPGDTERVWSKGFFDKEGEMLQFMSRTIDNHMYDKHPEILNAEWEESFMWLPEDY
jgi:hypothetical protein